VSNFQDMHETGQGRTNYEMSMEEHRGGEAQKNVPGPLLDRSQSPRFRAQQETLERSSKSSSIGCHRNLKVSLMTESLTIILVCSHHLAWLLEKLQKIGRNSFRS
jgi:hypothetical protein